MPRKTKLTDERRKTAEYRFYRTDIPDRRETWRFLVCDRSRGERDKTIAKFRDEASANAWLEFVRSEYIWGKE